MLLAKEKHRASISTRERVYMISLDFSATITLKKAPSLRSFTGDSNKPLKTQGTGSSVLKRTGTGTLHKQGPWSKP